MNEICQHVERLLEEGAPLDAQAAAHLDTCLRCQRRELDLAAGPEAELELGDLREAVKAARREQGLRARLRAMPTLHRRVLGAAFALGLPAAFGLGAMRFDLASLPRLTLGGMVAIHVLLILWAVPRALESPRRGAPERPATWLRSALAGAILVCLALLPLAAESATAPAVSIVLSTSVDCFIKGGLLALIPMGVLRLLDRSDTPWLGDNWALSAVAAGTAGNLGLLLACPVPWHTHLLLGHVGILVAYIAVAAFVVRLGSRRALALG